MTFMAKRVPRMQATAKVPRLVVRVGFLHKCLVAMCGQPNERATMSFGSLL